MKTTDNMAALTKVLPHKGGRLTYAEITDKQIADCKAKGIMSDSLADAITAARDSAKQATKVTVKGGDKPTLSNEDVARASGLTVVAFEALPEQTQKMLRAGAEAKAKKAEKKALRLAVSEKGCVSIYTGSRFPLSPYANVAVRVLLEEKDNVLGFIAQNFSSLSHKSREQAEETAKALNDAGFKVSDEQVAKAKIADEQ